MARTKEEKHRLFDEFIVEHLPRWMLHPEIVKRTRIRKLTIGAHRGARGMAYNDGTMFVDPDVVRFRHSSPYTSPKGKSDISPIGVLAHEWGHMLEFAVARTGKWDEDRWREIHRLHFKQAVTSYAKVHRMEDFAEAHRLWCLNPKLLKELSPERHKFINDCYAILLEGAKVSSYKQTKAEHAASWSKLALHK